MRWQKVTRSAAAWIAVFVMLVDAKPILVDNPETYGVMLEEYLKENAMKKPLELVLELIKGWRENLDVDVRFAPEIEKLHQTLLMLGQLVDGEICGARGAELARELNNFRRYSKTNKEVPSEPAYLFLRSLIGQAIHVHELACDPKNIELLKASVEKVPKESYNRVRTLDFKYKEFSFGKSAMSKLDLLTKSCYYSVTQLGQGDPDVECMDNKRYRSPDSEIPESKVIDIYERYIYQPCLDYNESVRAIIQPFEDYEIYTNSNEKELVNAVSRYQKCKIITGPRANKHYEEFRSFVDDVSLPVKGDSFFGALFQRSKPKPRFATAGN